MSESKPFVRLFVGLLLTATGVHAASCPIELSPPSVVVRYGHPVLVNCSTSELQIEGMGWEAPKGGRSLEDVHHLTWTVENLMDWNISPICYLNPLPNGTFKQCIKIPKVVLYTFPESISIGSSVGPGDVMREGQEYNVTCLVHDVAPVQRLIVTWYKGDTLNRTDSFDSPNKEPVNQSSVYSLKATRRDNGATFRCEAHMDLGPEGPRLNVSSAEHNVTVHYGPDIKCSALDLLEGETLKSHCPVEGNPTPTVRWMKDGRQIDPSIPLRRGDAGQYVVEADGASSVKRELRVLVMYGPDVKCSALDLLEGETLKSHCPVEGNPTPTVRWMKDGRQIDPSIPLRRGDAGQYVVEADGASSVKRELRVLVMYGPDVKCSALDLLEGETLKSHCPVEGNPTPMVRWMKDGRQIDPSIPLRRGDAGQYVVEADGASSVKRELRVLVMYEPELICPSSYTALENTLINLTCTVKGFPKPETTWYKDGDEVELPMYADKSAAGQYVITASNNVSSVNVTLEFDVLYPPSPIVELEDSEVEVGSSVSLKCSSTGNPRPKYFWKYYRTANVAEGNEDGVTWLLIHNATADNTGSYECHAMNDVDGLSKTARVTVKGAKQECPIVITPDRMVIPFRGPSQSAACRPTSDGARNVNEIRWRGAWGFLTSNEIWTANTREDWEARPHCTASFQGIGTCHKALNFTLYKTPDSVVIRPVHDGVSLLVEGSLLQLQCDVVSVAPARNLAVRWYQGNDTLEHLIEGPLRVTGCLPENGTNCDIGEIRSPLNVSSTVSIPLNRTHSGAEFRCVAQLDLGADGPQPPPSATSDPLNVTVHYKPAINGTKLPKRIPVFRGYPEELTCEADGHPPPEIRWVYSPDKLTRESRDTLTVFEAGVYNCTATNEVESVFYLVEVILKEDYLPLIAGFLAVTVVVIIIVFLFIYSIYYKNTRMRRYSLKNPKLSNHTGNVAHNGWDMQFPMTKLS